MYSLFTPFSESYTVIIGLVLKIFKRINESIQAQVLISFVITTVITTVITYPFYFLFVLLGGFMSYNVTFLDERGKKLWSGGGGCFGFIGKGSMYEPRCSESSLKKLNKYLRHCEGEYPYEHGEGCPPYRGKTPVMSIQQDQYSNGWCSLEWLGLVKSIPQIGKAILSGAEEWNQGYISVDAHGCGADETIQALMTLAAEKRYRASDMYHAVKDANVPQFLKLYFSLAYSRGYFKLASADSTLFEHMSAKAVKHICDGGDPYICPVSFNDIRIYPMTVLSRWKLYNNTLDMEVVCNRIIKQESSEVHGHFGKFQVQYIPNPCEQIEKLWRHLCKTYQ